MSLKNGFYDNVVENASKQSEMIDLIIEDAPILATLPTQIASEQLHNNFEQLVAVDYGGIIDLDSPLPTVKAESELNRIALTKLGGKIQVGSDKAKQLGGASKYMGGQMVPVARKTMEVAERTLMYQNIRAACIKDGYSKSIGGSSGANYSIVGVKWGEGGNTGLVGKDAFAGGLFFKLNALNGGNEHEFVDGNDDTIKGYQSYFENYYGIQMADSRLYGTLVNIDLNVALPTFDEIEELIVRARLGNNSALYMHPILEAKLATKYKGEFDKVELTAGKNIDTIVRSINGVPILSSWTFLEGTEPDVTLPS